MESTQLEFTSESERLIPAGLKNPMRIHSCLEREWTIINGQNAFIATGKIKSDFEWIREDGVIAAEHIPGVNIGFELMNKRITRIFSRHNIDIDIFDFSDSYQAFKEYLNHNKRHLTNDHQVVFGTLFSPYSKNHFDYFVSRSWQKSNLTYSQWGEYEVTVDNISHWLKEDLSSHYPWDWSGKKHGRPSDPNARTRYINKYDRSEKPVRPAGLVLFHPDGRLARIDCNSFKWWYEEGNAPKKKQYKRKGLTKEQWDNLSDQAKEGLRLASKIKKQRGR